VGWYHNEDQLRPGPQFAYPGIRFGTATFPLVLRERHYRVVNRSTLNVDDFRGTHLIKFGAELARVKGSQFLPNNRLGAFSFLTDTSTLPRSASIAIGFENPSGLTDAQASATGSTIGVYLNDEWRPIPNLAINLGVRYDAELNTLNNDYTVPWASDQELASIPQLANYLNRGDRENDLDNISPRISFSLDPRKDNRTFVRGGFAIIFDRVTSFIGFQERLNSTWRTYDFVNPGTTDVAVLRQRVAQGGVNATAQPILVKNKMRTPENWQWSLGVGHQFSDALGVNLDFVHQDIKNLYVRLNPNYFNVSRNRRELTTRFGDIIIWDDFGKAQFDALVASAVYSRGGSRVNLAYTLGWYDSEFDGNLAAAFPLRSAYDMQRTSGDERHRVVLSTVSRIPLGITFSGIATIASPRPFAVGLGRDANGTLVTTDDFPDGVRTQRPSNSWKNWYRTVDLRVSRPVAFRSGQTITAIAEVFNAFNSDNFATFFPTQLNADGTPRPNFGRPTSAFGSRQAQLGLRVEF
jgi:hypothetical protein